MNEKICMLMQLKQNSPVSQLRFMPYSFSSTPGIAKLLSQPVRPVKTLHITDYDMIYCHVMEDGETLDDIWARFNTDNKPSDYLGYSMSMSDVAIIIDMNSVQASYIDAGPPHILDQSFFTGMEVKGGGLPSPIFQAVADTMADYVAFDRCGSFIGVWYVPQGEHYRKALKWVEDKKGIFTQHITREEAVDFRLLPPPQCRFLDVLSRYGWAFGDDNCLHRD